jgi:hypothetical protein
MNQIQTIESTFEKALHIILDDSIILVTELGNFQNETWYSWSHWGPTEGFIPDYHSEIIKESECYDRINQLSDNEISTKGDNYTVDLFFDKFVPHTPKKDNIKW